MAKYKRKIKLIQPKLQMKLILTFLGTSALALTLQFLLFTSSLTDLASSLPVDGSLLLERVPESVQMNFLVSFGLLLPLTWFAGVLCTFRVAGPLYRFEVFLKQIIAGEKPGACRIRKGDELQEFCDLLNRATASVRGEETVADESRAVAPETARDLHRAA